LFASVLLERLSWCHIDWQFLYECATQKNDIRRISQWVYFWFIFKVRKKNNNCNINRKVSCLKGNQFHNVSSCPNVLNTFIFLNLSQNFFQRFSVMSHDNKAEQFMQDMMEILRNTIMCEICQKPVDDLRSTTCNHTFCRSCI
jgi:hypothetical protein